MALLIECGADVGQTDDRGRTAADVAASEHVRQLLRDTQRVQELGRSLVRGSLSPEAVRTSAAAVSAAAIAAAALQQPQHSDAAAPAHEVAEGSSSAATAAASNSNRGRCEQCAVARESIEPRQAGRGTCGCCGSVTDSDTADIQKPMVERTNLPSPQKRDSPDSGGVVGAFVGLSHRTSSYYEHHRRSLAAELAAQQRQTQPQSQQRQTHRRISPPRTASPVQSPASLASRRHVTVSLSPVKSRPLWRPGGSPSPRARSRNAVNSPRAPQQQQQQQHQQPQHQQQQQPLSASSEAHTGAGVVAQAGNTTSGLYGQHVGTSVSSASPLSPASATAAAMTAASAPADTSDCARAVGVLFGLYKRLAAEVSGVKAQITTPQPQPKVCCRYIHFILFVVFLRFVV